MNNLDFRTAQIERIESDRIAAAMAEFMQRGGQIKQVAGFKPEPAPPRKNWIDPDTVLKRKGVQLTRAERFRVRAMAEAL